MSDEGDRVREQHALFVGQIPELMKTIRGKWVVFYGGEVVSSFDTEDDALVDAMERYPHGGYSVDVVAMPRIIRLWTTKRSE